MNFSKTILGFLGGLFLGILILGVGKIGNITRLFEATFSRPEPFAEIPLGRFQASLLPQNKISEEQGNSKAVEKPECSFVSSTKKFLPAVILNEIAWMGNDSSSNNEWIEIKNVSGDLVDITNWQLLDKDGQIKIIFPKKEMKANEIVVLERGEEALPDFPADFVYAGNLRNSDESLGLFDNECNLRDEASAVPDWPAGNSKSKLTMERNEKLFWYTSSVKGGTPRKENSWQEEKVQELTAAGSSTPASETPPSSENPPPSPIASPVPPAQPSGRVLFSEIMVGTEENGAEDEFVELYNSGESSINLSGWALKKKTSSGNEYNLVAAGSFAGVIPAKGFFLITHKNYKGGTGADLVYSANSQNLAYTANAALLYNEAGEVADSTSWTEIPKGSSWERLDFGGNHFQIESLPSPRGSK